tara:strand:+ start:15 stop:1148 length:1134 start_codon:yes stop_codon:yes gene_type:complete
MSFIEKTGVDNTLSLERELSALSPEARTQVSRYIKKIIQSSAFLYHESEALTVRKVKLDKLSNRGYVDGEFVNSKAYVEDVKPQWPNITTVPVEGEQVSVIEHDGQNYYTSILNRTGDVNSNIVDGQKLKKFETRTVRPIELKEGSIAYEGRNGQSIHFDTGINFAPSIKMRAHSGSAAGGLISEDLDDDDSSIYLTSNGLRGQKFNGREIKGKNVFIKSDDIYIKGKKNVVIEGDEIFINAKSGQTIKMGDPNSVYIPTVNGKEISNFLKNLIGFVSKTMGAIGKASNPATLVQAAKDVKTALGEDLPAIVDTVQNETYLNKSIMTADPNFQLPTESPALKQIKASKKKAENLKNQVKKRAKQVESDESKLETLKT